MKAPSNPSLALLAAGTLAQRLGAMGKQIRAVRQVRDEQAIHRMRVASRRLRAALKIFADQLPPRKLKRCRKQVRAVTNALGQARDCDVQRQFVDQFLTQNLDKTIQPGIRRLALRMTQKREQLQQAVNRAMDKLESSNVLDDMGQTLHNMDVAARRAGADDDDPALRRHARDVILQRLDQLLGYEQFVNQPHMTEQLHQMRIAAKWLRYTMEVFAPLYGKTLKPTINQLQQLQTALGELHDADVWVAWLPQFLAEEQAHHEQFFGHKRGFKRLLPGIEHLAADRRRARATHYQRFVELWQSLAQQDVWGRLRRALDPSAAAPPPARTPVGVQPDPTPPLPVAGTLPGALVPVIRAQSPPKPSSTYPPAMKN